MSEAARRRISVRKARLHDAEPRYDWRERTPEERIEAFWQLTLTCLAWEGTGEPRLQRSVSRILRLKR